MSNMDLWDKVKTTNPDYTKEVSFGRKFTAIDAHYQIMSATDQFGAAGAGWGWSFSDPIFPPNDTVVVKCSLWHGKKENVIEQFGQKSLRVKVKGALKDDEDALKKAGTDALTKCLSYLGFNADVFLGKFDDNKYVSELKKEKAAQAKPKMSDDGKLNWFKSEVDKFKDSDLIGIPLRIVIGERGIKEGKVEIKIRRTGKMQKVDIDNAVEKAVEIYEKID